MHAAPGRAPEGRARRAPATRSPTSGSTKPEIRDRFAAYCERFDVEESHERRPERERSAEAEGPERRSGEHDDSLELAFVGCGAIAEWHLPRDRKRRHRAST